MINPIKNININAPLGGTGYGITSTNIIKALFKIKDLQVNLFPIGNKLSANDENEKNILEKCLENSRVFDGDAPCLKIWHQYDLTSRIGNGHYYSFPFFEIDKLHEHEICQLNNCFGIFVSSKWARDILIKNGVSSPIYVAPLAVDLNIFKTPPKIRVGDTYVFFHIGKWESRKAQDFLFKAFENAFKSTDNVELRLLPHNPFLNEEETKYWLKLAQECKLNDKIKIYNRLPTQYDLANFIFNADCGVYPSRAEGWNNEILESMALNKPVIVTNYSAHTEYCNNDNSFLINIDALEPANDGKWFNGFGNWAKLGDSQLEQTVEHMRYVYTNNIRSNPFGIDTCKKFTWDNTASIIHQTLGRNNSYYANTSKKKRRR